MTPTLRLFVAGSYDGTIREANFNEISSLIGLANLVFKFSSGQCHAVLHERNPNEIAIAFYSAVSTMEQPAFHFGTIVAALETESTAFRSAPNRS